MIRVVEHPVLKPELVNYGAIVLVLVSVKVEIVAMLLNEEHGTGTPDLDAPSTTVSNSISDFSSIDC